jgi:hypothetical protein
MLAYLESNLSPEALYGTSHRAIYRRILDMRAHGFAAIDAVSLYQELEKHHRLEIALPELKSAGKELSDLEKAGGVAQLAALSDSVPISIETVRNWTEIVLKKAAQRTAIAAGVEFTEKVRELNCDLEDSWANLKERIDPAISNGTGTTSWRDIPQAMVAVDIHDFLRMEIPPREFLMSPWLLEQSTNMIYGPRGTGKTLFGLSLAYAVASGGELLGWQAPQPRRVLYIDGEMLAQPLQQRLRALAARTESQVQRNMLKIVTPDLQEGFMPNLGSLNGQAVISKSIEEFGPDLVIIDSLSSLLHTVASENEAESWNPVAMWALQQRVKKRSLIFFHHANRRGGQRGTSKREDILDITLALRPGYGHEANKPAKFEIHIEKSRALCNEFSAIEAELTTSPDGEAIWVATPLSLTIKQRILQMNGPAAASASHKKRVRHPIPREASRSSVP